MSTPGDSRSTMTTGTEDARRAAAASTAAAQVLKLSWFPPPPSVLDRHAARRDVITDYFKHLLNTVFVIFIHIVRQFVLAICCTLSAASAPTFVNTFAVCSEIKFTKIIQLNFQNLATLGRFTQLRVFNAKVTYHFGSNCGWWLVDERPRTLTWTAPECKLSDGFSRTNLFIWDNWYAFIVRHTARCMKEGMARHKHIKEF